VDYEKLRINPIWEFGNIVGLRVCFYSCMMVHVCKVQNIYQERESLIK